MTLEPFKYLIQCIAIERDESGRVVTERVAQAQTVYAPNDVMTVMHDFEMELERLNRNGSNGAAPDEEGER